MNSDLLKPCLGVAAFLAAARLLLAAVCWHARRFRPPPELSRKALHVGMGTLFLACPWLFDQAWPVFTLAGCFVGLLLARHVFPPLQRHVEGVIYGVRRASVGEFYFPVAAALLFALSAGDAASYCIPLSLMAYADAAAAVIGRRYGLWQYRTIGGPKSVEGSAAFATVGFLLAHTLLTLLVPTIPSAPAVLIALNVALIGTLCEALAPYGLDNLAVPLISFLVLRAACLLTHDHATLLITTALATMVPMLILVRIGTPRRAKPSAELLF